ncbi:MAG TPA: hypothetical protein VIC26_08490 [Marinagarivorans sp.]
MYACIAPNAWLSIAAGLSLAASLLHIGIVIRGPDWYRFFGAGEKMATAAEAGRWYPALSGLAIAGILMTWSALALAGACGWHFPGLKWLLVLISGVFIVRGLGGFPLVYLVDSPEIAEIRARPVFVVVTGLICLGFGFCFGYGVYQVWTEL